MNFVRIIKSLHSLRRSLDLILVLSLFVWSSVSLAQPIWTPVTEPDLQELLENTPPQTKYTSRKNADSSIKVSRLSQEIGKLDRFISSAVSYNSNSHSAQKLTATQFIQTPFTRLNAERKIQVYLHLSSLDDIDTKDVLTTGFEIEVINKRLQKIQGWASPLALERLQNLSVVERISIPRYAKVEQGSITTEGDTIIRANTLRETGLTGKGVKIGILAEGSNDYLDAVASGDLPTNITRYGSCSKAGTAPDPENCIFGLTGTCNEGTAMAEIIHDIAPEAELAIAAVGTSLEFIEMAQRLAFDFKADIIVDDLGFFGESFYHDDVIAQELDALPDNILLVSSAGNSAAIHHEDALDYRPLFGANIPGYHDFNPQGNDDPFLGFIVRAGFGVNIIMQWAEHGRPYNNARNDINFEIYSTTEFLDATTFDNRGSYAFERLCVYNPSDEDEVRFLFMPQENSYNGFGENFTIYFLGSSAIEYPTPRGSIFGHKALSRTLAVGTINADEPGNDEITFYSSQGPSEILKIEQGVSSFRAKPDIIGIDGVSITGAGGFATQFFGTSAAAPHVAGVAALLKSVPFARTKNVRQALLTGATDLGVNGRDSVYGDGLINAESARAALKVGNPLPALILLLEDETP